MQILTLDAGGLPHHWMSWQDAITLKVKGCIAWEYGQDDMETYHGGTSRVTGLRTVVDVAPIIAVKGKFKYDRRTPSLTNQNLFRRDKMTCAYCGHVHSDNKLNRDHIIPSSKGGQDTWMNVVTSCLRCNWMKADRTPEQAGMVLLYAPYVPSRAEHLILKNRNILADQMEFLLSFVDENSRFRQGVKQ